MGESIVRTRYNIPGVHSVLVLDEAKAIHELDFSDLAGAMGGEVSLHVGLGGYRESVSIYSSMMP